MKSDAGSHGDHTDAGRTPLRIVARAALRKVYRRTGALPPAQPVVLLLSGYAAKCRFLAGILSRYSKKVIALHPCVAQRGPDEILDLADGAGYMLEFVIPLVDSVIDVSEVLNHRLGRPSGDPATSSLRHDKFEQQEALRRSGLPAAAQCLTADVACAAEFAATHDQVVVKPCNSSGGNGVWLCASEGDVRQAFASELGKRNIENNINYKLVVMQCFIGEEWVVNTVSLGGQHKVTDIWRGPSKMQTKGGNGPRSFIYDVQFLAGLSAESSAIAHFTFAVLDTLELTAGAAHTELVCCNGQPYLLEVNPRCAGGLPRAPHSLNQLDVLAMSLFDPTAFEALPQLPQQSAENSAAVVFLQAPFDGWLSSEGLASFAALPTFSHFDKGLLGVEGPPFSAHPVMETTGYLSLPGCVVLQGEPATVMEDVERVRSTEAHAYTREASREQGQ